MKSVIGAGAGAGAGISKPTNERSGVENHAESKDVEIIVSVKDIMSTASTESPSPSEGAETQVDIGILDPKGLNPNPLTGRLYSDEYRRLAEIWSKFPAYESARAIIQDIRDHQVLLVISGTGSGKTVLVPKYVLHTFNYTGKVAVTLPKQIIARSAAEFSAKTLDVAVGAEVGYKYKGSERGAEGPETRLLYATDGTIVARLLNDPFLKDYNAVIIDEAHERKIQIDFLLYLLRNTVKLRPDFKLVIMSATINETIFEEYFREVRFKTISVGTKTNYPITSIFSSREIGPQEYMKEGSAIVQRLLTEGGAGAGADAGADAGGDILFFVTSVNETLAGCETVSETGKAFCVSVYAGMDPRLQELAQDRDKYKASSGRDRKVVIATNVAESSLTIDGIKYVVDSGYELVSYYDPVSRARVLEKKLISRAQAVQRKGRAGRTEPGICYHLYTRNDFENRMLKFPEPSIRTSNISDTCLRLLQFEHVRTVGHLTDLLMNFIEPPRELYIRSAVTDLVRLGLIRDETITRLGDVVSELQLDPMQGVSLVLAYRLRCAKEVCAIFATIDACKNSVGQLFTKPADLAGRKGDRTLLSKLTGKYNEARKTLAHRYGDHLSLLKIFTLFHQYRKMPDKKLLDDFCFTHFLRRSILDKTDREYHRMKNRVRMVLSKISIQEHEDLLPTEFKTQFSEMEALKLEYKIMLSIAYGFTLNVTRLAEMKAKVSRDSFLVSEGVTGDVVYHELFSNSGKMEANIVSRIPRPVCLRLVR